MVQMDTSDNNNHKCRQFFFELIPKLAYQARDGTTKFKYVLLLCNTCACCS